MKIIKVRKADRRQPVVSKARKRGVKIKQKDSLCKTRPVMRLVGVKVKTCDAVQKDGTTFIVKSSLPGVRYILWNVWDPSDSQDEVDNKVASKIKALANPNFKLLEAARGFVQLSLNDLLDINRNGENSRVFSDNSVAKKKEFFLLSAPKLIAEYKNAMNEISTRVIKECERRRKDIEKEQAAMKDITQPGTYKNVTGTLSVGGARADKIIDATFTVSANGYTVWEKGEWKGGVWKDGVWKDGEFKLGVWEKGTWEDGYFLVGTWKDGIFKKGLCNPETWQNGVFENGRFNGSEWQNGVFKNGTFSGLNWRNGTWKNGYFDGKTWKNGTWENGEWAGEYFEGGTWKDGEWKKGQHTGGVWEKGDWLFGWWRGGVWKNGTWMDGTWVNGTWKDGEWRKGDWKGGQWERGKIKGQSSTEPPMS